jgi:hypothetical protein
MKERMTNFLDEYRNLHGKSDAEKQHLFYLGESHPTSPPHLDLNCWLDRLIT